MSNYHNLLERAHAKNIKTFGDIARVMGVDPEDIWPGEVPDLRETLYWCDGATLALECLAEVNEI